MQKTNPFYDEKGKKVDSQTYHRFRAMYYMACCFNYAKDNQDTSGDVYFSTDYAKAWESVIMGDKEKRSIKYAF